MGKALDLSGKKFNYVTPIRYVGSANKKRLWECKCDCGKTFVVQATLLVTGHTKSCGCWKRISSSERQRTHGQSETRLYRIWRRMKSRCLNSHTKDFPYYGGRGITICDEWVKSYERFRDWACDNGYSESLTLDRIIVNKGYSPDNCRWVDRHTQMRNTRSNRNLTFKGETKTITEWSEICKVGRHTIRRRLDVYGWSVEKALTTPSTFKYRKGEPIWSKRERK